MGVGRLVNGGLLSDSTKYKLFVDTWCETPTVVLEYEYFMSYFFVIWVCLEDKKTLS